MIEAAAGSGKTTRVAPALLALGGEVLVLEPRRIAARMAARRAAFELGEQVGETVGMQVRFEEISGPRTRLRFLTEGVLARRLLSDSSLRGIATVVLDEFHERSLDTDLALALLRRLQKTSRPDLRIVVMSATLDPEPAARFLGACPVVRSEGRLFPIETGYVPYSAAPLEQQVASGVEQILAVQPRGDVLVFLPGTAEIRRAQRACERLASARNILVAPLYGDLSAEEQDRAVTPGDRRKIILSTNVAESSITIEGVTAVVDSGLARFARDSPWTGLPALEVGRVSKASAIQRAGRAGRTAPGRVLRLFTAEDFQRRAEHDEPEILRRELSQICLQLQVMGVGSREELEWLDQPPEAAWDAARRLLDRLGAQDGEAIALSRLPLHPRLAKLVAAGIRNGAGDEACRAAALLSSGERVRSSDLLQALEEETGPRTRQVYEQIRRLAKPRRQAGHSSSGADSLRMAILAGFPDRVGRRRSGQQVLLSGSTGAEMAEAPGEFFVALDVEQRSERPAPLIRLACAIEPEWLIDLFPEAVVERTGVEWNRSAERVETVSALVYDGLVIEETRKPAAGSPEAVRLLAEKVFETGIERFVNADELEALAARFDFASRHADVPPLDEAAIRAALEESIQGLWTFAQVREAASRLIPALAQSHRRLLDDVAPDSLRLPGGRRTRIHYERGKPPWVASRMQDFFGMTESPRIARGQAPLVLHLLAPNQRPVQMTTDLAGFWERLYPQLRRELGRRYPKHSWPEKPA